LISATLNTTIAQVCVWRKR